MSIGISLYSFDIYIISLRRWNLWGKWARNPDLVHKFFMCQIGVGQAKRGSVFRFTVNGVYGSSVGAKYAQSKYPYHEPYKKWGTVAKLAMRQPFVLFKGLTFQKLCLPGAFRPGDHHNKMLRPGLCVMHASPQYL